jgi:inhibitor of cysteine peptidase
MRFEEDANDRQVNLRVGEVFEIHLPETRTTGYKWAIEKGGEPVCALVSESSDAPPSPPGRAGTHLWQFRAAQPGAATIVLHHKRPWEPAASPGRIFQLHVQAME